MNFKFGTICSNCKLRKTLVKKVAYLGYCEDCKHKAPTQQEYEDYANPTKRVSAVRKIGKSQREANNRAAGHNRSARGL